MPSRYQTPEPITPGERRELRSVVRQQMKVLRAEVKQRRYELIAEVEVRLAEKYRDEDRRADALNHRLEEIAEDANRQFRDILIEYETILPGRWGRLGGFVAPHVPRVQKDREQLRKAMLAGIETQVSQAQLQLDRQEADLLRDLAVDGLETDAARAFLQRIPTVAELVPSRRLREIETQFEAGRP